jgi:hypothetical protein
MTFWMNSPYCRELAEFEISAPGDIIEIRGLKENQPQSYDEIHGMIYISDDLVFSKNTSSRMSAYGIQRVSLLYQNFRLDNSQCKKIYGQSYACSKWANHYRCMASENDRLSFEKENIDFRELSFEVSKIENIISEYIMNGHGTYKENAAILKNQLDNLEDKLLRGDKHFFFQALLLEVQSLKTQIEIIKKQY